MIGEERVLQVVYDLHAGTLTISLPQGGWTTVERVQLLPLVGTHPMLLPLDPSNDVLSGLHQRVERLLGKRVYWSLRSLGPLREH
jgi:hypothetical protein